MAPGALEQFSKETGIKVNYDVYDSNEVLEAKADGWWFWLRCRLPSNSFFERQVKAGVYQQSIKAAEQLWQSGPNSGLSKLKNMMLATYTIFLTLGGRLVSATTPK